MKSLGIVLAIIGGIMLLYTGFTFTTKEKIIDAGPIEISKDKKHNVGWPPIAGGVLLVAGIVLIVTDKKR
ncbi:MAG TPA: hypothetical protein VF691_21945 [Cytophagaceae bacterium]|jgi:hypothetical protein